MPHKLIRAAGASSLLALCFGCASAPPAVLTDSSVAGLERQLAAGQTTPAQLTTYYQDRIAKLDWAGPRVNAVIELNPDATSIAEKLGQGTGHGALYGLPVLLKDNIDTGDRMLTTAGSLAMTGAPAQEDATLVTKLRAAGAVILGKTNLSEWANFRSSHSTSGWSGRGGLTRNPYALDRNACGSSSGSAAAVAAGFAVAAIGSETDGSIVCPSATNGLVGIKPTLGLVSRAGIIPISHNQDTAGPIAASVADAAAILSVIAGPDPRDPATADAAQHATDYTRFLDASALKGKRIGVVRKLAGFDPNVDRLLDEMIVVLKAQGAEIVDPVDIPHLNEYGDDEQTVLLYDFKHDLDAYLAGRSGLAVHSLADLIAFDKQHAGQEMPWFGQDLFEQAEAKGPLTDKAYTDALEKAKRLAGPEGIDAALAKDHLDALLAPTGGPAWTTDLINGDHTAGGSSSPAAVAGYPDITVPAGFVHCLPVGMSFFSAKWSEPTLIAIAYAYEQASHLRRPPEFLPAITDSGCLTP
ncbi:MAG TPA: amidase [Gammaproteobacteria bacterium]|nr:amidase [Gammaproteobacteria bacterium]